MMWMVRLKFTIPKMPQGHVVHNSSWFAALGVMLPATLPKKFLICVSRGGENAALVFSTWLYNANSTSANIRLLFLQGKKESYLILNSLSSGEDYISLLMFSKYPNKFPKIKDIPGSNLSSILQDTVSLSSLCLRCLE